MPDNERDERINDLLGFAVDKKPSEFQQTFNDIVLDRLAQAVDARKLELAQSVFNNAPPEEPEEEPEVVVDDEPEEEEQDPNENA